MEEKAASKYPVTGIDPSSHRSQDIKIQTEYQVIHD